VDFSKSTQLDDTFIFTHVQHAVATYKRDTPSDKAHAMAAFRKILKQFPDRGEPSNYYGELLLDQEKYEESVQRFDKSLELDKNKWVSLSMPDISIDLLSSPNTARDGSKS
jgi:import receptor subunit TOM70